MAGIANEIIEKDGHVLVKRQESAPESICAVLVLVLVLGLGACAYLLLRAFHDGTLLDQQYDTGGRFSRGDYIGGGIASAIWAVMGSLPFLALAQVLKYQRIQTALLARILETQHH